MKICDSIDELRLEVDLIGDDRYQTVVDDTLFASKFFPYMFKFEDMDIICGNINVSETIRKHEKL